MRKNRHRIAFLSFVFMFISCKSKNVYSDESKQLVLVRCNFTNLAIKFGNNYSKKDLNKEIDCLCYLDKIHREFTQEEYFQMTMNPNVLGKEKLEKLIKFQKDCAFKLKL